MRSFTLFAVVNSTSLPTRGVDSWVFISMINACANARQPFRAKLYYLLSLQLGELMQYIFALLAGRCNLCFLSSYISMMIILLITCCHRRSAAIGPSCIASLLLFCALPFSLRHECLNRRRIDANNTDDERADQGVCALIPAERHIVGVERGMSGMTCKGNAGSIVTITARTSACIGACPLIRTSTHDLLISL